MSSAQALLLRAAAPAVRHLQLINLSVSHASSFPPSASVVLPQALLAAHQSLSGRLSAPADTWSAASTGLRTLCASSGGNEQKAPKEGRSGNDEQSKPQIPGTSGGGAAHTDDADYQHTHFTHNVNFARMQPAMEDAERSNAIKGLVRSKWGE